MSRSSRDKSKRETDDERFPYGQMLTLAICKFSEPIAFNSVIAYTYVMVQWLHDGDDTNASFYAGLLVSAYAFGEVFTAVIWGTISDRIGRKPVVLFGLCGVAISCVMFGLARSYWVALLARLIGGMLNGNVAVMQTMLAEMVKRPEHEPTAYAIHPFVWFAGGIVGSAMGGYLSQPAHFYPSIFPADGLFGKYPYLLPNIVCVVAIAIAVIQGAIFLEETNPYFAEKQLQDRYASEIDETTPLQKSMNSDISETDESAAQSPSSDSSQREPTSDLDEDPWLKADGRFDLRRSSFGTMEPLRCAQPPLPPQSTRFHKPDLRTTFNFTVVMLIVSFVLCSYHGMGYSNMLPIYLLDKPRTLSRPDFVGGLGYNVHAVGSFMAANGLIAIVIQALVFPPFVRRIGIWRSFIFMIMLYPIGYSLIPFLTLIPAGGARSAGIYGIMLLQNHLNIIIPPCALILIKNATPSPLVLGLVNGTCMSLLCAARTIAPPLQGIIYGKAGSAANWYSMAGVAVVGVLQLFWIPRQATQGEKDAGALLGKNGDVENGVLVEDQTGDETVGE